MNNYLDAPEIPRYKPCPGCGENYYEVVFFDADGRWIGCDCCVSTKNAWDYMNELEEERYDN